VEGVLSPVVLINGAAAAAGDPIPGSATLSTNNSGVLDFLLHGFLTSCQLRPASQITIEAAQRVTIRYERGAVWCQSSTAPQREVVIDVGVRQVRVTHARFGLRDGQIVVDSGDVVIASASAATGAAEQQLVREDQICHLDTFPAVCASYTPDQRERATLDSIQRLFDDGIATSTRTPEVSVEPSDQPRETTEPPAASSEPAPNTTPPPPEPSRAPSS
jgi:ferric-dicitrate binding protein FerR (iron transport regulator)